VKQCALNNCELCNNSDNNSLKYELKKYGGWKKRLILAFKTMGKSCPNKVWLSLTNDIYPFFEAHQIIWPASRNGFYLNWKKKVQDSLSHSKDIFESGASFFGKKGYWRLVKGIPEPEKKKKLQHNQSVPVNITSTDHLQIPIIDMKESNVTATLESQRIPTLEINTEFKVPAPMKRNKHHESSHNTRITTNSTPLNAINLNTALPTMQKVTVQPLPMAMHSEIGSLLQTRDIVGKVDGAADNILSKDFEHFLMRSGIKKNFFQGYSATV